LALKSNPGASSLGYRQPCNFVYLFIFPTHLNCNLTGVYWFGANYPQNSPIYEASANLTGLSILDSTYVPPPSGGWPGTLTNSKISDNDVISLANLLSSLQLRPWVITGASSIALSSILGAKAKAAALNYTATNASALYQTNQSTSYSAYTSSSSSSNYGILGTMESRYYAMLTAGSSSVSLSGYQQVPYFVNTAATTSSDLDDALSTYLQELIAVCYLI
jgi:hypothetical protein